MSDEPESDLPEDIRALLDAERSRPALPPERVARIRRGAEQMIALAPMAAPLSWTRRWVPRGLWLVAGIALGVAGYAWLRPDGSVRTRVVVRLVYVDATVPADVVAPVDAAMPLDAERQDALTREVHSTPPARGLTRTDDHTERALMDRGRSALLRGDEDAALDAMREHARRFPNGALQEEREALWVRALRDSGRASEAREKAESFVRRWPRSLLRPSVESALHTPP